MVLRMTIRLRVHSFVIILIVVGLVLGGTHPAKSDQKSISGKIVCSSYTGAAWQLCLVDPNDKDPCRVIATNGEAHHPSCCRDRLAYADHEGQIWIMYPGGPQKKLEDLPKNCNHPSWSPDGSKIAFVAYTYINQREESDIWIADLKENRAFKLLGQRGIQEFPAWSPDGKHIVYSTGYRVSSTKVISELWLVDADGGNPHLLLSDGFANTQPVWSPDGKRIAFASDKGGNMNVWVTDRTGGNIKQVTSDGAYDGAPSWSPEGSQIAFMSTRNGQMEIWIMNNDGSNPRQLTGLADPRNESKDPYWCH